MGDKLLIEGLRGKFQGAQIVAATAREEAAVRQIAVAKVSEAIVMAASAGHDELMIEPENGLDLRKTDTGMKTLTLLRTAGFECTFEKRQPRPDTPAIWVLRISWAIKEK